MEYSGMCGNAVKQGGCTDIGRRTLIFRSCNNK